MKYKKIFLLEFSALFAVFAIVLIVFQWQREREFRKELLEARLQGYADIIALQNTLTPPTIPAHLRATVIKTDGKVLFETNANLSVKEMGNHINRPEISEALKHGKGCNIRQSTTTGEEFFYFAKRYNGRIVRVALPFDIPVKHFIKSGDNLFLWVFMFAFTVAFGILFYMSDRFGRTVQDVKTKEREKANAVKRQMTSNIAHELRTPVTAIHGYIETLLKHPNLSEERKQHFLRHTLMQSERLTDLIRDVSIISKMEEAPTLLPRETVCINNIVKEIAEEFSTAITQNGMTLHTDLPDGLYINGNYSLIYSIFRNLVENSIRYAGNNTEIHIILTDQTLTHYSFVYYDTGKGIAPNHLNRIFERFYRIEEGRTRNEKGGTGLGLSIVKNAVLFHRGTISAHNRPEGGLEFRFTLNHENTQAGNPSKS